MAIKFVCSCGKRLRARDEMAARRSLCPACGEPVGIPSLKPTARGATAGPMTPAERLSARRRAVAPDDEFPARRSTPSAIELSLDGEVPAEHSRPDEIARLLLTTFQHETSLPAVPTNRGELRWPHALAFAFQAAVPVLFYGLTLTLPVLGTFWLARLLLQNENAGPAELLAIAAFYSLLPLSLVGGACGFLDSVLAAPPTRDAARLLLQPSRDIGPALRSAVVWLACFLAGPVLPAALACWHWLYGGVFTPVDWCITLDLCSLAVGYWMFALLAVHEHDRLRDLHPARVADLVHRLGYRAAGVAGLAAVFALGHGAGILAQPSWYVVMGVCLSGMFCATFLFRLAGIWCQQRLG